MSKVNSEAAIRQKFTAEAPSESVAEAVTNVREGLNKKPDVFGDDVEAQSKVTVPKLLNAMVSEIGRQKHGVAVFACCAWMEGSETVVSTQAVHLPNPLPGALEVAATARQHFAHYALGSGGLHQGLVRSADNAYPMPYPDFSMGGRPALPRRFNDWAKEKISLSTWLDTLWAWQGGQKRPDWDAIVQDVNAGGTKYFEKKRLPARTKKMTNPDFWDEAEVDFWSTHIRSTMDAWGRVLESKQDEAIQFHTIDDHPRWSAIQFPAFLTSADDRSSLRWSTSSLLYEAQVKQTICAHSTAGDTRASALYDQAGMQALIDQASAHVPGLVDLLGKLRAYERRAPPVGDPNATAAACALHPALSFVQRTSDTFAKNWDLDAITYPDPFFWRSFDAHVDWHVTKLRTRLAQNPFWDETTNMLLGGYGGISIAFYAIAQYAVNISRVMPENEHIAAEMALKEEAVYGMQDYVSLGRCVELVEKQLDSCAVSGWTNPVDDISMFGQDQANRYEMPSPTRWVNISATGIDTEPASEVDIHPDSNLFARLSAGNIVKRNETQVVARKGGEGQAQEDTGDEREPGGRGPAVAGFSSTGALPEQHVNEQWHNAALVLEQLTSTPAPTRVAQASGEITGGGHGLTSPASAAMDVAEPPSRPSPAQIDFDESTSMDLESSPIQRSSVLAQSTPLLSSHSRPGRGQDGLRGDGEKPNPPDISGSSIMAPWTRAFANSTLAVADTQSVKAPEEPSVLSTLTRSMPPTPQVVVAGSAAYLKDLVARANATGAQATEPKTSRLLPSPAEVAGELLGDVQARGNVDIPGLSSSRRSGKVASASGSASTGEKSVATGKKAGAGKTKGTGKRGRNKISDDQTDYVKPKKAK